MSFRVKRNDNVTVISGQEKGKSGKVIFVDVENDYVKVENVNMVSRHKKAKSAQDKAGITKMEGNIHISNVMIVCPACEKAVRIKAEVKDGVKRRVCRKCGASLESKADKKADKKKKDSVSQGSDSRVKRIRKTAEPKTESKEG